MAGEIGTNYFNQGLCNQYNNPYLMQGASSMNDDFMAQTVFGNSAQQVALANYANTANAFQGANLQGAPSTDTFQSSSQSGGSSIGSALVAGVGVGGATAAGVYYFGSNPVKDGKVDSSLLETLNKQNVKDAALTKFNELYKQQANPIYQKVGISGAEQYNAVEKLAGVTKLEDLPQELRAKLPSTIQSPEAAKKAIEQIKPELAKIDVEKMAQQAGEYVRKDSLAHCQTELSKYQGLKSQVEALKPEATTEELATYFKNNASTYGLKGTQVEIANGAENLARQYKTQQNLLSSITEKLNLQQSNINRLNLNLESQFASHWDDGAKALQEGAPKELGTALKNFKLQKAGKIGLIAGGIALLGGYLFGGKSQA